MGRYNAFNVFWQGLTGNKGWERAWRDPEPKVKYDVIIIGGGGHGLATAYYLAKNHGIRRVAVLERLNPSICRHPHFWLAAARGGGALPARTRMQEPVCRIA